MQWDQLCDGCAKCCTIKLEDEDTSDVYDTDVVCRYLDLSSCRCQCYQQRSKKVPECVVITPDNLAQLYFMPPSCSYRLLYEGKPLPQWHPLNTGNADSVHTSHQSVRGKVISEDQLKDDLLYHLTGKLDDLS